MIPLTVTLVRIESLRIWTEASCALRSCNKNTNVDIWKNGGMNCGWYELKSLSEESNDMKSRNDNTAFPKDPRVQDYLGSSQPECCCQSWTGQDLKRLCWTEWATWSWMGNKIMHWQLVNEWAKWFFWTTSFFSGSWTLAWTVAIISFHVSTQSFAIISDYQ